MEVQQLNLDAPVTREQYEHAVRHMVEYLGHDLTRRHGWCEDRYRYFAAVIPEYRRRREDRVNFEVVPQEANYAQLLKDIRARILWYVAEGDVIHLDEANEVFAAGGLPEYGKDEKLGGHRVRVALPYLDINVAGAESQEQANAWAQQNMIELIVNLLDGKPVEEGSNKYVPASGVFDMSYGGANAVAQRQARDVDQKDIMVPLRSRGTSGF
jgi:hypothetical protein